MIHVTTYATRQLLRETIIDELQVLPELLRKAEKQYYRSQSLLTEMRDLLANPEGEFMNRGAVTAPQEAVRQPAQRPFTGPLLAEIRQAEAEAYRQKTEVDFLLRRQENYHIMAKLLMNP
jgi:hypothetical protein